VRIVLDSDLCTGHGRCYSLAPELFDADDEGHSVVAGRPELPGALHHHRGVGRMEVWELVARESIRDLVARYNANGDAGRFDQVLALFADDAAMEIVTSGGESRRYEGHQAIATIFTATKERWDGDAATTSPPPGDQARPRHVRHFTSTHQIDVEDRTHATGRSYFAVLMPHGLDHWGRYLDTYEERGGRWVFTSRRALPDGRREAVGG